MEKKSVGQIIDELLRIAVEGEQDRFYWENEAHGYELSVSLLKVQEEEVEE